MSAEKTIRQLLESGEFVWAPCVYDCVSAKCAEIAGYNACLISSCELEYSLNGTPSGVFNWEEFIGAAYRIAHATKLPVIMDGENGGGTPMRVYRNVKRIAEAGIMAISIEDTNNGGFGAGYHYGASMGYMSRDLFAANIKAAIEATKGTDCMVIARTDCKGGGAPQTGAIAALGGMGLDEAIIRANIGVDAGAEITMIQNICHADCADECMEIKKRVPGYHFYPDVHATNGKPDCTFEEMQEWGFQLVSNHVSMKAAIYGMLEWMRENYKNKNSVYSENRDVPGIIKHEFQPFDFSEWITLQKEFEAYQESIREKNKT
jgi:methylisocitrate lyase